MDFPNPNNNITLPGLVEIPAVSLDSNVQLIINGINADTVIPYGDFGGPNLYWFQTFDNGLGNLVYTVFDRKTTLGLASYMVRYGAAATIRDVIFQQYPQSEIKLQFLILPPLPVSVADTPDPVVP